MSIPSVPSLSGAPAAAPAPVSDAPSRGAATFATTLRHTRESGPAPESGPRVARRPAGKDRNADAKPAPRRRDRERDEAPQAAAANPAAAPATPGNARAPGASPAAAPGVATGAPAAPSVPRAAQAPGAPDATAARPVDAQVLDIGSRNPAIDAGEAGAEATPARGFLVNGPATGTTQADDAHDGHGTPDVADDDSAATATNRTGADAAPTAPGAVDAARLSSPSMSGDRGHASKDDDAERTLQAIAGAHAAAPGGLSTVSTSPPALSAQASPSQPQAFAQETSQYVSWLVGQGFDKAEIRLNPRELGPIHVEITQLPDHIDVNFAVQHPQTVHALQQVLPQLHDMLAQQGLNLGQASVGQQSSGHPHPTPAPFDGRRGQTSARISASGPQPTRWTRSTLPGGVDDFA